MTSTPNKEIFFTGEFKRNLRQLAKKYRHIKTDIEPLINELAQGAIPGDKIPGVRFDVYKVRVANSDAVRGKRGGYRVIYQIPSNSDIVLITIYSKTEQDDIKIERIRDIINQHEEENKQN
jgi:mRNA-degrading endonuclease RelE of RelBE toxin-antitoxin system